MRRRAGPPAPRHSRLATDAGAGHRAQPVGGDGPRESEDRKPLYRTDPATSTSFNTSSSRCTVTQIKAILPIIFHRMEATCFACGQTVILYCKISGSSPNSNANKAAGSCCDAASDHTCVSARLGATRFSSSFGGQSEEESATEIERSQQHSSACE
ncbi:uncharacterized protein LOC120643450 isoform X4 [Panicum virgatum]|uniref:uncharacterized protein LOC120643450 isoform X4 n=1 Tax=Panicum virgatum TaxID=38727 RepID=UPI0019D5C25F|nr:uncharacterized protein LOC120643450 isoform X4 [Panicum virgatum]